jgi:hypothetical protein
VLTSELSEERPIAITKRYSCNAFPHMVSIVGTARISSRPFVKIYDSAGEGGAVWSLWNPKELPQEPRYEMGRSYFNVRKAESVAAAKCTPEDGNQGGCVEEFFDEIVEGSVSPALIPPNAAAFGARLNRARESASAGVECEIRQVGTKDPESLGFSSAAEAQKAVLSSLEPMKVGYVHAGSTSCQPNDVCCKPYSNCPECLLFFYRVEGDADGAPRGGVVVDTAGPVPRVVKFAGDPKAKEIANKIQQAGLWTAQRARQLLIVPELNLRLVEIVKNGSPAFMPDRKLPHFNPQQSYSLNQLQKTLKDHFPMPKPRLKPPPP